MGIRSFIVIDKKRDIGLAIFSNAAPSGLPEFLGKTFFQLLNKADKGEKEEIKNWENDLRIMNERMISALVEYNKLPPAGKNHQLILPNTLVFMIMTTLGQYQ